MRRPFSAKMDLGKSKPAKRGDVTKAKKKNTPKRKKHGDTLNAREESVGRIPKKSKKEKKITPSNNTDGDSDLDTDIEESSLKDNELDTESKDKIQELEEEIPSEKPEVTNPKNDKVIPPVSTPKPPLATTANRMTQDETPRKGQESTNNISDEVMDKNPKDAMKYPENNDFATPKKKNDEKKGPRTVYYGTNGRKQFRYLEQERKILSESVQHNANQKNFYSWLGQKNDQLNKRCEKGSKFQVSNAPVKESTLVTRVIHNKYYGEIPNDLVEFANVAYREINLNVPWYMDSRNSNVYVVPLCTLTNAKDYFPIICHSKLLLDEEQQVIGLQKYVYECCFVNNLHQSSNSIIRQILNEFFVSIFDKEIEHIKRLLQQKETMVLLIVNRDNDIEEKNLEVQHIIAGVMFSTNKYDGILIDFLCAGRGFHGYGYGTLLLHFAQVCGREHITKECSKKKMAKEVITCLACRTSLMTYYKNLGFDDHRHEDFLINGRFKLFGPRIEIKDWIADKDKKLQTMSIDCFVTRYLNIVHPDMLQVEKVLYDGNLMTSFQRLKTPTKYETFFKTTLDKQIEIMRTTVANAEDMREYQNSRDVNQFSQKRFPDIFFLPIGKWFNKAFENHIAKCDLRYHKNTKTVCIAMEFFELQILPDLTTSKDLDKCPLWICMRCASCKKKAYVCKEKSDSFKSFMLKVTYSLWFSHVFSYEIFENDEWHQKNPDWTICNRRHGEYFYKIKKSTAFDKEILVVNESDQKKMYVFKVHLEKFFKTIAAKYLMLVNEFLLGSTFIQNEIETANTVTTRIRTQCKTYIQSSYPEDDNNNTNKNRMSSISKSNKIKHERVTKKKRHDAEKKWNEIFYDDIEKQLQFRKIEYVTPEKPSDQLHEESKEYYKMRDRLKNNNYIDRFGELQKEEHYIAYYENGTVDVLDEDWFTVNPEDERTEYRLTPSRWKHINRHPNEAHTLSSKDRGRIKKYCNRLRGLCDIKSLKRININDIKDVDERLEIVKYFEMKRNGNKVGYVTHLSTSKYEYEGIDRNNSSHKISKDWVELNYKEQDPSLYKEILNLKIGESIKFTAGSSASSSDKQVVKLEGHGRPTKFIQGKEPSCLFLSLANALHVSGEEQLAYKIVQVSSKFFGSKEVYDKPLMKDILFITKSNGHHEEGERRFKFQINKMKHPVNALEILETDVAHQDIIYHCVLTNSHSICFVGSMIIDPVFACALPRNERYFRMCAELNEKSLEKSEDSIVQCYKYSKVKKNK